MTAFMILDEDERKFERLEDHPERHAMAFTMYALCGQRSAHAMEDGRITPSMIRKVFVAYPKAKINRAIEDLVTTLGLWERLEDGDYQHRDWDSTQFTKEKEMARREKQKAYQRERRRGIKRKSPKVAEDVAKDVGGDVSGPSASASANSPDPLPKPGRTEIPRSRSGGTDPVFEHWLTVMGKDPQKCILNTTRAKKMKARRAEGYTDPQLIDAIDGCKLSAFHMGQNDRGEVYNDLATILKDGTAVEAHRERKASGGPRPLQRAGRPLPTRGTTDADFAGAESIETQLARI